MMKALGDQVAARGRERHEPQCAERRQLRRIEGQPVPDLPDPLTLKNGDEGHDRRAVVDEAPAGDRRGLRPRGLRPRARRTSPK